MWAGFAVFVVVAVAIDLLVMKNQGAHRVSVREALNWSILWISLSFVFCGLLWWHLDANAGREMANLKATEFLTGYLDDKTHQRDESWHHNSTAAQSGRRPFPCRRRNGNGDRSSAAGHPPAVRGSQVPAEGQGVTGPEQRSKRRSLCQTDLR